MIIYTVEFKSIILLLVFYLFHMVFIFLFLFFFFFFLLNLLYFLQLFLSYNSLSCYFAGQDRVYIAYFQFFSIYLQVMLCYFICSIRALQQHTSPCLHSALVLMSYILLKSHYKPYVILFQFLLRTTSSLLKIFSASMYIISGTHHCFM